MFTYSNQINQNCYDYSGLYKNSQPTSAVCNAQNTDTHYKKSANKCKNSINYIPYNSTFTASSLRTRLNSSEEESMYKDLVKSSDRQTKRALDSLLKKGILLNAESSDNSTVLSNLHKVLTTQRAEGLENKALLKDIIATLNDPHIITQQFGDIPKEKKDESVAKYIDINSKINNQELNKHQAINDINVTHSGTCVAASIEFTLAKEQPAEFARIAEGLTSPKVEAEKLIHLDKLADNVLDAIWLLNAFEVPYTINDFYKAKLKFKPDESAILRAQIQTKYKDPGERSPIDALMQSTFMQIGSQQSYNSLSDKRKGKFNQNDKGLIEFEKTFVESVVEDQNKISVTYQTVDENARLIGYQTDMETLKKHLKDTIDSGHNVILGYTQTDSNNVIINGHEITVTGYKLNPKNNKLIFICNDTDDNISKPIEYSEDFLLPRIHHAALPKEVIEKDVQMVENWVEGLNKFQELRKNKYRNAA